MLRKFCVTNYRGFKDKISFDLTRVKGYTFNNFAIKNNLIKNGIIYGKNGSGKSNLGEALFDLIFHLARDSEDTMRNYNYLNGFSDLSVAKFSYEFLIDQQIFEYTYEKTNPYDLAYEALAIDGKKIFSYNFVNKGGDFSGLSNVGITTLKSDMEMNISVLRYIIHNTNIGISNPLNRLMDFINRMLWLRATLDRNSYFSVSTGTESAVNELTKNDNLQKFQTFLADNGVDLNLSIAKSLMNENVLMVRFGNKQYQFDHIASHGTKVLLLYFFWLIKIQKSSFVFIDEFDAFFHNEVTELILKDLVNNKDVQFFITTHRTSIMTNDLLRPDCYFIIGNNKISSLPDITDRELREGHNLEKLLRGGSFDIYER